MAIAYDKAGLLAAIDKNDDALCRDLCSAPQEKVFEASLEGRSEGSVMSVADIVADLIGRMIPFNTTAPYENARKRVRVWKQAHGTGVP